MFPRFLQPLILAALLLSAGCKDRQITAYRAPKDPAPAAQPAPTAPMGTNDLPPGHPPIGADGGATTAPADMANTAVPTASGAGLTWTAPARWTAKAPGAMRKGSYAIKDAAGAEADMSITAFPGDTGGLHANLNRWRGQVGLPPASPADLDAALLHLDGDGLHFDVIDLAGTTGNPPVRMLGAIASHGGNSWFFKLMGPDPLVAGERAAFLEFLQTVKAP